MPLKYKALDRLMKSRTKIKGDGRDERDWANFDMMVDNAQALNARIFLLPHVYYISGACDATKPGRNGMRVPDPALVEPLFFRNSMLMGRYNGTTQAGQEIGDEWHANDGLVNTVSARAPFGDPQQPLDRNSVSKGVWNVMPDIRANHSFFQGGFFKKDDPFLFFQDLMQLLKTLD